MKDLIITINANTRNALFTRNFIGVNGEYLDGYIKVDFQDEFIDGIATFEFERSDGKYYIEMEKGDDDFYYLQIKSSLLSKAEKLKCQIRVDQAGEEVFKCRRFPLYVLTAVNSATTIPEDYGDWLSHANQKLLEIDEAIDDAEEATTRANTISQDLETKRDNDYYRGETGNGIASIVKTSTSGLVDTYTVTMTDETTTTFTVTNGAKGDTGATGNGISSITKTGTAGLVDTYTVLFTDGTSTTFTVTNGTKGDTGDTGNGIASITKTSTSGLVDTYTIAFTDGNSTTFTVTNGQDGATGQTGPAGNGIASIVKTSTSGLVDTYTITFTDTTTTTFTVTNGETYTFDTTPTQNSTNPVTSGGVYSAIKGLRVKFSRWMRWEWDDNTQSGSHDCSFTSIFQGTSGNLADNEFISSVTLHSHGSAYSNNAIAFITGFTFTSSKLNVTYYRDSNDNNLKLRCMVVVCKIE